MNTTTDKRIDRRGFLASTAVVAGGVTGATSPKAAISAEVFHRLPVHDAVVVVAERSAIRGLRADDK